MRCKELRGQDTRSKYSWLPRHTISQPKYSKVSDASVFVLREDCGYYRRCTGIPEDEEGVNLTMLQIFLDKFEREIPTGEKPAWQKRTYRYVFYGVPTFSNPTGSIMSLSRRIRLIDVWTLETCTLLTIACKEIRHPFSYGRRLRSSSLYGRPASSTTDNA